MGHPAARNGIPRHLLRALVLVAETRPACAVSRAALFLLNFLLFKLMLMSGVVKLTSGDESWANLTALDYHYWTQPLPTVIGWWADKSPEWFKHFSAAFVFSSKSRPASLSGCRAGCACSVAARLFCCRSSSADRQLCFFNLLTIALCLLLIDDAVWPVRLA